jgi:PAS domain S-box-containing protein
MKASTSKPLLPPGDEPVPATDGAAGCSDCACLQTIENSRDLSEVTRDWIWEVDASGVYRYVSNSVQAVLGYAPDEVVGRTPFSFMSPSEAERVGAIFGALASRGEPVVGLQDTLLRRDGTPVVFETHAIPLRGPGGTVRGYYGMCRDVTERTRVQEAWHRSERTSRALIDATPDTALLIAPDATILAANRACVRALGAESSEDVEGKCAWDFVPQSIAVARQRRLAEAIRSCLPVVFEDVRDGRILLSTIYPIVDGDGQVHALAIFARDLTAQREMEARLSASSEQLRQLARRIEMGREEERKSIARELHDQVGQTLTALKMDVSGLQKRREQGCEVDADVLQRMNELIERGTEDVRRLSAQLRPGALDDFGLEGAIEWQVDQFRVRSDIRFRLDLLSESLPLDEGQRTVLFRVFQELVTNVVRHADAHSVEVSLRRCQGDCLLEVIDDGCGIDQRKLSDPSSLGLIGMRERLLPFDGTLDIEGHGGQGTVARVSIPIRLHQP